MDDEILIGKVRQHDELYNTTHRKYSDNRHKDLIWAKIGKESNTTGQVCKTRWISLRDQLRKALKKKRTKSRQTAGKQKKWKYEDRMSFVIPFFKERDAYSNIASPESASEESNDEDISNQNNNITEKDADEVVESKRETTPKCNRIKESLSTKTKSTKKMKKSISYCSNAEKISKPETASPVSMAYVLDSENDKPKAISCASHPIDVFFQGLAATVKTFSPEYQHVAKNKLFAIVSDLEWAKLQNKKMNKQIAASRDPPTSYFCSNLPCASTMSAPGIQNSLPPYDNTQFMRQGAPSNTIQYVQAPTQSPTSRTPS
ncbi:MADF domain [Cinara cedri]|uniref:MADF domain n=1 Tax=Cinara cedri TaxID=506608 RepID=A0A5E4NEL0_9HEMI|nr:MADF domain [Cinara cedri]